MNNQQREREMNDTYRPSVMGHDGPTAGAWAEEPTRVGGKPVGKGEGRRKRRKRNRQTKTMGEALIMGFPSRKAWGASDGGAQRRVHICTRIVRRGWNTAA